MSSQTDMSLTLYIVFAAQIGLGAVFLLSVIEKTRHPRSFVRTVIAYDVVPIAMARVLAMVFIVMEAVAAASLVTGWITAVVLPIVMLMLLAFLYAVVINLRRKRQISCGCFGDVNDVISLRTVVRLCLIISVVLCLIISRVTISETLVVPASMLGDGLSMTYLLQSMYLGLFLVLAGSWLLTLPELLHLGRAARR